MSRFVYHYPASVRLMAPGCDDIRVAGVDTDLPNESGVVQTITGG